MRVIFERVRPRVCPKEFRAGAGKGGRTGIRPGSRNPGEACIGPCLRGEERCPRKSRAVPPSSKPGMYRPPSIRHFRRAPGGIARAFRPCQICGAPLVRRPAVEPTAFF